ncbi:MAG: AAA family ATPase [Deltaproteobacteria bacterium]|nr:AAA family ATPase [Deltaproteobacteria bacterium]
MDSIAELLASRQVIVSCGTGGVGKTTVSVALALAAARLGRRVLVMTIDPSRRLAEVLGVDQGPRCPVPLPAAALEALQLPPTARVEAWMLDPMRVADDTVRSVIADERLAQSFLENPIYRQLSAMAAGMHEYTAMKALFGFVNERRYDLVIVDTPPARHALDFLDAPARMVAFFESRVFSAFAPARRGVLRGAAARLVGFVLRTLAGKRFATNLMAFLAQFTGVFSTFESDVTEMRRVLASRESAFLMVTSPVEELLQEAMLFRQQVVARGLPFCGYILNQSRARFADWSVPDRLIDTNGHELSAELVARLRPLAEAEQAHAMRDVAALDRLRQEAGDACVCDLPLLGDLADGLAGLAHLTTLLLDSHHRAAPQQTA